MCSAVEMRLPVDFSTVEGAFHEDGAALQSRCCDKDCTPRGMMTKFKREEHHE